jgi:hypothetical protein
MRRMQAKGVRRPAIRRHPARMARAASVRLCQFWAEFVLIQSMD